MNWFMKMAKNKGIQKMKLIGKKSCQRYIKIHENDLTKIPLAQL
jgi:hypothetical protein